MKPFLKWVGGKTQILDEIIPLFPRVIKNYYEPFLGGGSVLLALLSEIQAGRIRVTGRIIAGDLNRVLVSVYKNLQEHPEDLIRELGLLVTNETETKDAEPEEKKYYTRRANFNSMSLIDRCSVNGSALFIYLNKTCFRGLYREGPAGFNVPFGHYKKPAVYDADHLRAVSRLIQPVRFRWCGFQSFTKFYSGDFVYFDPPYEPINSKSFVAYNKSGFGEQLTNELFTMCHDLTAGGIKFILSNSETRRVLDAFAGEQYTKKIISCKRAINSKKPDQMVNEVLVLNWIIE